MTETDKKTPPSPEEKPCEREPSQEPVPVKEKEMPETQERALEDTAEKDTVGPGPSEEDAEALKKELESLKVALSEVSRERDGWKAKAESVWDQYLRARAEMDNFRKRTERDVEDRVWRGKAQFLVSFLDVMDNFDYFLAAAKNQGEDSEEGRQLQAFCKGVSMIHKAFLDLLAKEGVVPIESSPGQLFDPRYHEAMLAEEGQGEHGTIVKELRKGYLYQGRLLRPARVTVRK